MRLVYVIEKISTRGGLERILIDKMNALAELPGYEVFLLTVWSDTNVPAYDISDKVHTLSLNVRQTFYPISLLTALRCFNKAIKDINPDVTILFRAVGSFIAMFTNWKGSIIFESHLAKSASNHRWIQSRVEKHVDAVVCLTEGNAKEFSRAQKVVVIPNFTNMPTPQEWPDYNNCHAICVGRLDPIKNHDRLVGIWNDVHRKYPGWVLDIYGDGELHSAIQKKINSLGLSGSVILHGNTENIQEAYMRSSMILMTSISEGMPMTLIEAQRCGLPIISFDCPFGPADIIDNGNTGYLIPYNDDKAMTDAICQLMNNPSQREAMGHNARHAAMRFSKSNIIQQWDEFFRNIIR